MPLNTPLLTQWVQETYGYLRLIVVGSQWMRSCRPPAPRPWGHGPPGPRRPHSLHPIPESRQNNLHIPFLIENYSFERTFKFRFYNTYFHQYVVKIELAIALLMFWCNSSLVAYFADEDDWPGGTLDGVDNDVEERTKAKACGSGEQEVSNDSEVAANSDHDEEIFDDIEDDCPNKSSEALDLEVAVLLLGQHERCANVFSAGVMGGVCGEEGAAGAAEPEVGRVGLFPRDPDAGTALGSLPIVL
ncbi:unnamed protein product [Pieris macdunnoughi]|uniref:Uncharacterized protein n=1 Tax=Pieris macdunnoughi TaxID=345717 RepID=A0A821NYD8_9NEOP|nr:unnamed protein product [Pieris macdunnoughi]